MNKKACSVIISIEGDEYGTRIYSIKRKQRRWCDCIKHSSFPSNVIDEEENLKLAAGSKPFKYPLSCKIVNDQLILNLDVKVKYSVNVNDTCSKVQGKIFENIEHMTGYTPDVIDIRVVGFIF